MNSRSAAAAAQSDPNRNSQFRRAWDFPAPKPWQDAPLPANARANPARAAAEARWTEITRREEVQ